VARKRDLEIALQGIPAHPHPKAMLEQYTIPAELAADILFSACYAYGDIHRKSVIDLGSGTGRLALGAMMLGAQSVVGIDIDNESLRSAQANGKTLGLEVDWILGDIVSLHGTFETVLMNPPFGTKRPHSDIRFLRVALKISKVIYSIHKSSTMLFISRWLKDQKTNFETIMETSMPIKHQFRFHTKKTHFVRVHIIRIHHQLADTCLNTASQCNRSNPANKKT
jgi:putative methylase